MLRISEFYGIAIYMYYQDHAPPHFHAIYAEHEATIEIDTSEVGEGKLPRRAKSLVVEWAELHRDELRQIGTWHEKGNRSIRSIPSTREGVYR